MLSLVHCVADASILFGSLFAADDNAINSIPNPFTIPIPITTSITVTITISRRTKDEKRDRTNLDATPVLALERLDVRSGRFG